ARPDKRCREAYLTLGRGHERLGAPGRAWASYDRALELPPHESDAVVQEARARAQQTLVDKLQQTADRGPQLYRMMTVRPAVDFASLEDVLVVLVPARSAIPDQAVPAAPAGPAK
ncbi:MAG: hypothetical protein ABJC89_12585, partial [Acidobacteriota bacterium]